MQLESITQVGRTMDKQSAGAATASALLAHFFWSDDPRAPQQVSIGRLARLLDQDYDAVWRALRRLEQLGVIEMDRVGPRVFQVTPGTGPVPPEAVAAQA